MDVCFTVAEPVLTNLRVTPRIDLRVYCPGSVKTVRGKRSWTTAGPLPRSCGIDARQNSFFWEDS